jgi:predicted O-methyltransferase YrrM
MEGVLMKNITDRLMQTDPTLQLHNEGEWSGGISAYSAFNSGGVECEVGEFFYSFLRMIKPENVLETGTHYGVGASYMGMALKDNAGGHLDTIEFLDQIHPVAVQRMKTMGLEEFVTCHFMDAKDFNPGLMRYQFILLDTEPQTRFSEFLKFYPYLDEGGYMFIHDLGRGLGQSQSPGLPFAWPFGLLPDGMIQLMKDKKIRPFHFSTPRGLSGFYRVTEGDYKYE